ncbi:MAG: MBG domain-containing protein [Pirellulales bacterium]
MTKAALLVTADDQSREYGDANPTLTATITGFKNSEVLATSGVTGSPDLSTAADPSSPVGDYPITAALGTLAASNYSFTFAAGNLAVTKAALLVTADDQSREYGEANPTLTATITGFKNSEVLATSGVTGSPDLSTAADPTSPVGDYPVSAALGTLAATNYSFTFAAGNLEVTKAALLVTADDQSREYGDANPTLTATITGFKNSEVLATSGVTGAPDLSTAADPLSPVGDYPITAALGTLAASNYSFTFAAGNLAVTKAALLVTADDQSRGYGDANPTLTATITGFKNSETLAASGVTGSPDLSTAALPSSPLGDYPITAALGTLAASNYSFSFAAGNLEVTHATITATIVEIAPDPYPGSVSELTIVFSQPVTGFDLSDLNLDKHLDGLGNRLTGSESLTTADNQTYTLGNLGGLTQSNGGYTLSLRALGSGIANAIGDGLSADATESWQQTGIADTIAPTVTIQSVTPNPHTGPVNSITIVFTEPVTGFDRSDLNLDRASDGLGNLLTASQTLTTSDNKTFVLGNLAPVTNNNGNFVLSLNAAASGVQDLAGNPLANNGAAAWQQTGVTDTTAPKATIQSVTPNPHTGPVDSITIVFTEPVTGFDRSDLNLDRASDGLGNLLTASQTLTTSDNKTFVLGNLTAITGATGNYNLYLAAGAAGIADLAGNPLTTSAATAWTNQQALALAFASLAEGQVQRSSAAFDIAARSRTVGPSSLEAELEDILNDLAT